jgi:hypothetical protein
MLSILLAVKCTCHAWPACAGSKRPPHSLGMSEYILPLAPLILPPFFNHVCKSQMAPKLHSTLDWDSNTLQQYDSQHAYGHHSQSAYRHESQYAYGQPPHSARAPPQYPRPPHYERPPPRHEQPPSLAQYERSPQRPYYERPPSPPRNRRPPPPRVEPSPPPPGYDSLREIPYRWP